jgi:hypothetical protein
MRDEPRSPRRALCLAVEFRQHVAAFLVTFSLVFTTAACGGGNDSGGDEPVTPPPPQSTPGQGVAVRGTERLAWDQTAPSYQQLVGYVFSAYVDGTAVRMTGVECGATVTADGFRCSAPLPPMSNGTHVLQVSAIVAGAESARSQPLTVTMNQGRMVSTALSADPDGGAAGSLCLDAAAVCLARRHEVTRPLPVSSPAATPDGRLLFVEDGRTVRVLANGVVSAGPALATTGAGSHIVALLIDPEFERTQFVRVAWTEEHPGRGRVLTVARLREVNGRLGEMAVIVPDIPVSGGGNPHVVQDSEGRIYITMPAADDGAGDPYAGQVLTFTADGRSASDGPTPIVTRGYDRPDALTFDARTRRLWLSGSTGDLGHGVMSIARGNVHAEQQASAPQSLASGAAAGAIVGFAPLGLVRTGEAPAFLALDADGTLMVVRADAQAFVQQGAVTFDAGRLLSLQAGAGGPVFVTAVSDGDSGPAFSIYRLEPER